MLTTECLSELRTSWLPNLTDGALGRLIDLLEKNSPLLIHGAFTRSLPMGCLATQAAWHHPQTARLSQDAGIIWLHFVAGLNPATSRVIAAWDSARSGFERYTLRQDLLGVLRDEQARRAEVSAEAAESWDDCHAAARS